MMDNIAEAKPDLRTCDRQIVVLSYDGVQIGLEDLQSEDELVTYLTIGAGETHISLLDAEGRDLKTWIAVVGWSALFMVEIEGHLGQRVVLDSEEAVIEAMSGKMMVAGADIDTVGFIASAIILMRNILRNILAKTLSPLGYTGSIVLAAPLWLHGCLQSCISSFSEEFHPDILEAP